MVTWDAQSNPLHYALVTGRLQMEEQTCYSALVIRHLRQQQLHMSESSVVTPKRFWRPGWHTRTIADVTDANIFEVLPGVGRGPRIRSSRPIRCFRRTKEPSCRDTEGATCCAASMECPKFQASQEIDEVQYICTNDTFSYPFTVALIKADP